MQRHEFSRGRHEAFRFDGSRPLFELPRRSSRLAQLALFEGCDPTLLQDLEARSHFRTLNKGRFVFLPGDPADHVYFLLLGLVKISRLSEGGKEFILSSSGPGQMFVETDIFGGGSRETAAEALEPARLLSAPSKGFRHFLARNPESLLRLTEGLTSRHTRLERRIVGLAHKNTSRRLAELLVQLSKRYGKRDRTGTLLQIKLSQRLLGSFLGVSREIVNRAISDLKRQGVIEVDDQRVIIRNPKALSEMAV